MARARDHLGSYLQKTDFSQLRTDALKNRQEAEHALQQGIKGDLGLLVSLCGWQRSEDAIDKQLSSLKTGTIDLAFRQLEFEQEILMELLEERRRLMKIKFGKPSFLIDEDSQHRQIDNRISFIDQEIQKSKNRLASLQQQTGQLALPQGTSESRGSLAPATRISQEASREES